MENIKEIWDWISENSKFIIGISISVIIGLIGVWFGRLNSSALIKKWSKEVDAKKEFKRKVTRYKSYLKRIDTMHDKRQKDYQEFILIMNKLLEDCNDHYNNRVSNTVLMFSGETLKMDNDTFKGLGTIESKTLTASKEVIGMLDEVINLYDTLHSISNSMYSYILGIICYGSKPLPRTTINDICKEVEMRRTKINEICGQVNNKMEKLREQIHKEINQL